MRCISTTQHQTYSASGQNSQFEHYKTKSTRNVSACGTKPDSSNQVPFPHTYTVCMLYSLSPSCNTWTPAKIKNDHEVFSGWRRLGCGTDLMTRCHLIMSGRQALILYFVTLMDTHRPAPRQCPPPSSTCQLARLSDTWLGHLEQPVT